MDHSTLLHLFQIRDRGHAMRCSDLTGQDNGKLNAERSRGEKRFEGGTDVAEVLCSGMAQRAPATWRRRP